MKKSWLFSFLLIIAGVLLTACGDEVSTASGEKGEDVIRYQVYRSVLNPIDLAVDLGYLDGIKMEAVGDYKGGTESVQLVGTGEVDVGWGFNGALVKAKSKNVNLISVLSNYGSDEQSNISAFVLEDSDIQGPKDFIGKKVGVNILGAHLEFVIKEYLTQGGLTKEEINQVQLVTVPMGSSEQTLRAGQLDVALLMGSSKDLAIDRGGLREVFDDTKVMGQSFTAGNYFFKADFVEKNPEVVKRFTEAIAKTIEWSKETPREEVIARMEKIIQERNPNESTANLKYWKSFGIASEGGVIKDDDLQIWIDWLEKSGELKEGEIVPSDLYTNEFNPYAK